MKIPFKLFAKAILRYLAILSLLLSVLSCNKDADSNQTLFNLNFTYYDASDEEIYVYFATSGKDIPEVEVNGVTIDRFSYYGGYISGSVYIPFDEKVKYSVTANDKTTSGSIKMPEFVDQIQCNNITINESYTNYFSQSGKYVFEWDEADCDHQFFTCSYVTPSVNIMLEPDDCKYTLNDNDLVYSTSFSIYLDLMNGDRLVSGSNPGVSGDYGDGYVTARANCYYYLNFGVSYNNGVELTSLSKKVNTNRDEQNAIILNQFDNVCKQRN